MASEDTGAHPAAWDAYEHAGGIPKFDCTCLKCSYSWKSFPRLNSECPSCGHPYVKRSLIRKA